MAESNSEQSGRLKEARRQMEDALVVMDHLEIDASQQIKEHAEFMASHQLAMREFDEKLNAIIGRQRGR